MRRELLRINFLETYHRHDSIFPVELRIGEAKRSEAGSSVRKYTSPRLLYILVNNRSSATDNRQVFVAQLVRALVSYFTYENAAKQHGHPKVVSSSLTEDIYSFAF